MRAVKAFSWIILFSLLFSMVPAISDALPSETSLEVPDIAPEANDADEAVLDMEGDLSLIENGVVIDGASFPLDDIAIVPEEGLALALDDQEDSIESKLSNTLRFYLNENVFPDPALRAAISSILGVPEGEVVDPSLAGSVTSLSLSNLRIQNLEGLWLFDQLTELDLSGNPITEFHISNALGKLVSLDLSNCTSLEEYSLNYVPLEHLNISGDTSLKRIDCYSCKLSTLDFSTNTALEELHCYKNPLSSLDLPYTTALTILDCNKCPLTSLDVSHNPMLRGLSCSDCAFDSIDISNNPLLIEIYEKGKHSESGYSENEEPMRYYETYYLEFDDGTTGWIGISKGTKIITTGGSQPGSDALKLSATALTLGAGEKSACLVAKDSKVPVGDCAFKSSKTAVATVSESGVVTGVKAGKATVSVTPKGGKAVKVKVTVKKAPSTVTLNKTTASLYAGKTLKLSASLPNGTASAITWKSSNKKVATVGKDGVVKAVKKGTAKITASTFNGKSAVCTVTVEAMPSDIILQLPGGGVHDDGGLKVDMGVKQALEVDVSCKNAPESGLKYTASKKGIVKLSGGKLTNGKGTLTLTAVKVGKTTITASVADKKATIAVTVKKAPDKITLSAKSAKLGVGESFVLEYSVPKDACAGDVTYASSNAKCAKVNQRGKVVGVKAGTATITVKAYNGEKAACKVTVYNAPKSIKLKPAAKTLLSVGKSFTLETVYPKDTYAGVFFSSDREDVATVNEKGKVTARGIGVAVITAKTSNGKKAKCIVTVPRASMSNATYDALMNKEFTLTASFEPANAKFSAVKWTSSDTSVAKVNNSGVVKTLKLGTATITATVKCEDGTPVSASCVVNVVNKNQYTLNVEAFLDPNGPWANGKPWGDETGPQTTYPGYSNDFSGCAAYALDFVRVVWGIGDYKEGARFDTDPGQIQDGDVIHILGGFGHFYVVLHRYPDGRLLTAEGNHWTEYGKIVRITDSAYTVSDPGGGRAFDCGWHNPNYEPFIS